MEDETFTKDDFFFRFLGGYSKCRDLIWDVIQKQDLKDEFPATVFNLIKFIAERSTTVTFLVQNNLLWDAQILMRTVLEATLKLTFLCNCDQVEQKERLQEYLHDLEEINALKQSKIAANIIDSIQNRQLTLPFAPLVLKEEKELILKQKWPSNKRRALEQKWSFSEIMKAQSKKMGELEKAFLGLAHSYKISSHLLHADETGVGIIAERSLRSEEDKDTVETYHFCGILRDSILYFITCGYSICRAFGEPYESLLSLQKEMQLLYEQAETTAARVFEDNSYDKFRE